MRFGRWLLAFLLVALASGAMAQGSPGGRIVRVSTMAELGSALAGAAAGDVITLSPGTYRIERRTEVRGAGTKERPIVVRGEGFGVVRLETELVEAIVVAGPHWIFENLDLEGLKQGVEHAFHVVGRATGTIIRKNLLHNFDAAVKGNGLDGAFPDDVLIEDNAIYNDAIRETGAPVTPLDIDGGKRWIVRGNFIADFGKSGATGISGGTGVSYGAFMKANSSDGIFERNLVICEWRHTGGIRIGLSFGGGGGESAGICEDNDCTYRHRNGTIRNNIILHCTQDIGIYVNKGKNTKIYNNTMFDTYGIDVRYPESDADIRNNIIAGGFRGRDGGTAGGAHNLVAGTSFSPLLPGTFRFLKSKIEGLTRKYPNFFPLSRDTANSWVDRSEAFLAPTWLGRGSNRLSNLFVDVARADFNIVGGEEIIGKGEALREVTDDFCGNPRLPGSPDLGAIEYRSGTCSVAARVQQALRMGTVAGARLSSNAR